MNSSKLNSTNAGRPRFVAGVLLVVSIGLQLFPNLAEALQWRRGAGFPFSLTGLFTGHLTHWSWNHLAWDLAAFAALSVVCLRLIPGRYVVCLAISAIVISLEIALNQPQFESYRGLSGIDSALFGLAIAGLWRLSREGRILGALALVAILAKTGFEHATGQTLFVSNDSQQLPGFVPATSAHVSGLICGLATGWIRIPGWSRLRRADSSGILLPE